MADHTDKGNDNKGSTTVTDVRSAVENANAGDEADKDDDDSDDDSDDDGTGADGGSDDDGSDTDDDDDSDDASGDDGDDDKSGDDKSGDGAVQRKYSQYKGDGSDGQYISNLEKAYENSSAEAIRLKTERDQATGRTDAILRAAAADPELAKKLNTVLGNGGSGSDDGAGNGDGKGSGNGNGDQSNPLENPFVKDMQTRWNETSEKEVQEILDANPELLSDTKLGEEVKYWMGVFSNQHYNRTGKLLTGGEAMEQAMRHLNVEDKRQKQDLATGAKKNLTPTRKRNGGKKSATGAKPEFSPEQIAMAKNMGRDEAWLAKNATT